MKLNSKISDEFKRRQKRRHWESKKKGKLKQVENKYCNGRLNPKLSIITLKASGLYTLIMGRDFQTG